MGGRASILLLHTNPSDGGPHPRTSRGLTLPAQPEKKTHRDEVGLLGVGGHVEAEGAGHHDAEEREHGRAAVLDLFWGLGIGWR